MKKILIISPRIPYPPVGGDKLLIFNQIKYLSNIYDIDLLYIDNGKKNKDSIKELKKYCNNVINFNYKKPSFFLNVFNGLMSNKPLQVHYFFFKEIKKWITQNYQKYDLIYNYHIRTAEYIKDLNIPKIINLVDAISLNYQRAQDSGSGIWNLIYNIEKKRVLPYELECIEEFDKSFLVSNYDVDYLIDKDANPYKIKVLPVSVNEELLKLKSKVEKRDIVFLGKMNYQPNVDAVIFFTKKVLPYINKKENIKFYIVGAYPTNAVKRLASNNENVIVTGFVDDPYEYLQEAKLVVAPMISGAGIQNKVLESMAIAKPVITTEIGAQGISQAENGNNIFIRNKPIEMKKIIIRLLNDSDLRKKIGFKARETIKKHYTMESLGEILEMEIEKAIK